VRLLFVDDLTIPVLQMLGTKYGASFRGSTHSKYHLRRHNIEPFFFTSSINWIPSRYQEAPIHGEGDRESRTSSFKCYMLILPQTSLLPCHTYEHGDRPLLQINITKKHHSSRIVHLQPRYPQVTGSTLRILFFCSV